MSQIVLLNAAAVGMLIGISILRFEVADPGIMLLAVILIALLGVMHGVRGGLFGASVAAVVLVVWAFTKATPVLSRRSTKRRCSSLLGLLSGIYAHGALGDCDRARPAARRASQRDAESGRWSSTTSRSQMPRPAGSSPSKHLPGGNTPVAAESTRKRSSPSPSVTRTNWKLTLLAVDRSLADVSAWGDVATKSPSSSTSPPSA